MPMVRVQQWKWVPQRLQWFFFPSCFRNNCCVIKPQRSFHCAPEYAYALNMYGTWHGKLTFFRRHATWISASAFTGKSRNSSEKCKLSVSSTVGTWDSQQPSNNSESHSGKLLNKVMAIWGIHFPGYSHASHITTKYGFTWPAHRSGHIHSMQCNSI